MQELIFLAHLAYASGRSFVFDPYTWNRDMNENFTLYNNKLIPSRIPLNAIIAGPAAGAPFDADNLSPRAVNREYFEAVCKSPRLLTGDDVPDAVWSGDGDFIMQHWVEKLNKTPDPCILLDGPHSQIFPYYIFGVKSLVDTWPWLSKSPILTQWRWSPLVETALHANNDLVMPAKSLLRRAPDIVTDGEYSDMYAPIPGLLAMHVRRGDYIGHCDHLAKWGSHWQGWNTFPEFIDKFEAPPGSGNGEIDATPAAREVYQARCLPNHEQIVARVAELRKTPEGQGLRSIFVMTNAKSQWASELKSKLMATGGWDKVVTSRDLRLTWEQKFVGQAIDMLIGQRAQMFIGNGWSSMTANTVMLRQSKKMNPRTNRFW
ncbi:hypothetical protein BD410DRAFT_512341 [Rickenella mellea]|uniref:Uncharacterized protein n=1 Tax=Rickenella mellea TaxID=50990 RepID=A0A4Y7PS55_9AGAM|nr:hypothetical protein BD410DRAFT_512341 [Rickenella mellea]